MTLEKVARKVPSRYAQAYLLGVLDGFAQPYFLTSSYNVDEFYDEDDKLDIQEIQDRGISLGQFLRAGYKSQASKEFGFGKIRRPR